MREKHKPIGHQLIEERERQSLSPKVVLSILRIREQILDIIENDLYPSQEIDVFLKGHIVSYCRLLKINPQTILNQLEAKGYDFPQPKKPTVPQEKKRTRLWLLLLLPFGILLLLSFESGPQAPKRQIAQPISQEYSL